MKDDFDQKELPEVVQQYIERLARKVSNRHMRRDVASELSNHFADALADTPDGPGREKLAASLISDFGDTKLLAKLIRRAKRRCYPMWLRVVGYTCRTIIIIFLISFAYTTWFLRGKPTVSVDYVEKFNQAIRPIADESLNAAPHYFKAVELYVDPEEKYDWLTQHRWNKLKQFLDTKTRPQEFRVLTNWIQSNTSAIAELRLGTAKPYCWFRYDVRPNSERRMSSILGTPQVVDVILIGEVLSWRMQFAAEREDWDLFAADLKCAKTLARHLMQCPMFIEKGIGANIDRWTHIALIQVLQHYTLPPSATQRLAQALDESFPSGYPIADMSFETFVLLDAVQRLFTDDGSGDGHLIPSAAWWGVPTAGTADNSPGYYYASAGDPYFVARTMIHPSRRETVQIIKQWKQMSDRDLSMTPYQNHISGESFEAWLQKTIGENPRNLFIRERLPGTQRASWRSYAGRARHDAARTIVALLRYQADHGQFTEKLDELVPQYLKVIPQDPFGSGALSYERKGNDFVLYSWGLDFEDSGGQHNPDVFRMRSAKGDYVFWPPEPTE